MLAPDVIRDHRAILIWLMLCIQLVASIVIVGGYTRLSGSGLSITEWKPIHGIIPPGSDKDWQEEFDAYKNTPQYKLINKDMSLDGFKTIFWPEYIHRLLGRITGIVFALPLFVFALRKSISRSFFWRMAGILLLGGIQGGIGWMMVKSGLQDAPYVSHTKLALHLSLAFTIFALILWTILDVINRDYNRNNMVKSSNPQPSSPSHQYPVATYKSWFFLLCIQIIFGGFMAGLHAGLIYNTWPTMDGDFFPDGLFSQSPPPRDLSSLEAQATLMLQNITFIQFIHRTLAVFLVVSFLFWCYLYKEYIIAHNLTRGCILIGFTIFTQFTLGVLALIYSVPLPIALAHHLTALLLWGIAVWFLYELNERNQKTTIKSVK